MLAANGNPHVCCACQQPLNPEVDAVVYLGWGKRHDGKPGPGWVAALCAPTPAQVGTGSPCVVNARAWATANRVALRPATLKQWLGT